MNWIALVGLVISLGVIVNKTYKYKKKSKEQERSAAAKNDLKTLLFFIGSFFWCIWSLYLSGDIERLLEIFF